MANLSPHTSQIRFPILRNPRSGSPCPVFVAIYDGISDASSDLGSPLAFCFGCRFAYAAVLVGAGVAHCPFATRAHGCVLDTSRRLITIHAGQSDCPTFNGSSARLVALRADPQFAAELLGWHGGRLYAARGSASAVAPAPSASANRGTIEALEKGAFVADRVRNSSGRVSSLAQGYASAARIGAERGNLPDSEDLQTLL